MQMKSAGFTIVELLASLAIASVVAGATVVTLVRQQRFYTRTADVIEVKSQLRDAAAVLTGDIRGAAVNAFGVPLMADSAVELFTTIGSSIVCAASAQQTFGLPPSVLVSGNTLTSLLVSPDTADLAEIYTSSATNPDSAGWETRRVSSFTSRSIAATCATSSGFTSPADGSAGATGYQLVVSSAISNVRRGAPVRFLRRARYSIYKSSDNLWYLGYRRCAIAPPYACAAIQPVSGPYRSYSATGTSGVSFRFYDALGAELSSGSSGASLARVEMIVRGQSASDMGLLGDARKPFRDSVVVTVSPRNRVR